MISRPAIKPVRLKQGATIGVVATSSYVDEARIESGVAFLKARGFDVRLHADAGARHGQFAGDEGTRVQALHDFIRDPSIHGVMAMHGGNGALHLLDLVDYGLIRANPKIIIGFSDVTALLNAITARTGLITFHGPTLTRLTALDDIYIHQLFDLLMNGAMTPPMECDGTLRTGHSEGILVGGNLSALQTLIGTSYAYVPDGAILMIEDINDHLSRYDRMIGHIKNARWFEKLAGLVIGEFLNSQDNEARPFGFTVEDRINALTADYDFPILIGAPVGHGSRLFTLPIGGRVALDDTRLTLLESPLAP